VALASSYVLAGLACAQVSIAGQYPDPIWLPAGIALGWLLVAGTQYWLGVLMGAVVYNGYHLIHQGIAPSALVIASVIAVGSTLQAAVGAWLCGAGRHGASIRLDTAGSTWKFLLHCSPVACLISPTVGIFALLLDGRISRSGAVHDWFYWWSGDAIGVLLVVPVVLVAASKPSSVWRARRLTVGLPLAVATSLIFLTLGLAFRSDSSRIGAEFQRHATLLANSLEYKCKDMEYSASSVGDLFRSATSVGWDQFQSFTHGIYRRHPSIQAIAWAPFVPRPGLKRYEQAVREAGNPGFRVEQKESNGLRVAVADRSEYFPIQYVYPLIGNEVSLGYDIASETKSRAALHVARQRRTVTTTESIRLVTDSSGDSAVLIFDPVFRTVASGQSELSGITLVAIRIGQLVRATFSVLPHDNIAYLLEDASASIAERKLYANGEPVRESAYRAEHLINIANRVWRITFWPTDEYVRLNASWSIPLMQLGTLTFSMLLSAFLLILSGRSIRIEEQVIDRTREVETSRNQLQQAWKLLQEAVGSVSHGFIIYDQEDRLVMVNDAYRRYYAGSDQYLIEGETFEQIIRDQVRIGIYDLDGQDEDQWLKDKIMNHQLADGRATECLLSDGRWLMMVEQRTPSGYIVGNRIDITELKQTTAQLQDQNAKLDTLFQLSPDGLVVISAEKIVVFVNPSFLVVTGLSSDVILGRSLSVLEAELQIRVANQEQFSGLSEFFGRPGDPPRSSILKLRFPKPTTLKLVGVWSKTAQVPYLLYSRDVTLETELDEMKSEFLAHAAHELRTPLTSIYGFSELLLKREFDETTRRDLLETIYRQTAWLADIINELLDLARIDSRRGKDFKPDVFDLHNLVAEVVASFAAHQDRWPMSIAGLAGPVFLTADLSKSRQAITNVLSNAKKYSPAGGEIRIQILSADGYYGVAITDRGLGMTHAEISRVTERFWRSDTSGVTPGTGLGMAIVKEILEIHGGRLEIQSAVNVGTTVTLLWPVHSVLAMAHRSDGATTSHSY
jgi:signal transduction histidine kinase/CHASE1-domain containing sensor protein